MRFWAALHTATNAMPAALMARSKHLRRLRNWLLYRLIFAVADDMQRLARRDF
jgi:hypothetical protein